MAYPTIVGGHANISGGGVAVVDCQKQVRSWRLLRSLMELLIPCCNGPFIEDDHINDHHDHHHHIITKHQQNFVQTHFYYPHSRFSTSSSTNNVVTGTIFGYRRGKVSLCIQTPSNNKSGGGHVTVSNSNPILLLELAVSTSSLAREMRGGFLRIALESTTSGYNSNYTNLNKSNICNNSDDLLSTPVWTMYCNGRKVGYAVKRRPAKPDLEALRLMGSVVTGAGIITGKELNRNGVVFEEEELLYLRARFERVRGSGNSESFHLIDPDGCIGQELSVFFYRSR